MSETSNSLKLIKDEDEKFSILGISIKSLGGDKVLVDGNNIYEFTTEIHKALSNENYTGKSTKNINDKKTLYNFLTDIGYNGRLDAKTSQKKFFRGLINQFRNMKKEDAIDLKGEGIEKIIIPSKITDIYTRLEILLGLKISGHTNTLTEASNLIDELYKRGEIENKQQYQNALNKFSNI